MMNIGQAVEALKDGRRVARAGWNGKGMWLVLVRANEPQYPHTVVISLSSGDEIKLSPLPWVGMRTADEKFVPWLCSQTDLLAEDWEVVS